MSSWKRVMTGVLSVCLLCGIAGADISQNVYCLIPSFGENTFASSVILTNQITIEDISFDALFSLTSTDGSDVGMRSSYGSAGLYGGLNNLLIDPNDTGMLRLSFVGVTNVSGASAGDVIFNGFASLRIGAGTGTDAGTIYGSGTNVELYSWTGGLPKSPADILLAENSYQSIDIGSTAGDGFDLRAYTASFTIIPEPASITLFIVGMAVPFVIRYVR
ncbi:MAG: hypothetical protein WC959_00550 [Kiritimatiellales bacterium]